MTYEEFIFKSADDVEYYMDIVRIIELKVKHRMPFTDHEIEINNYILRFQESNKINELRTKFQKCWDIKE